MPEEAIFQQQQINSLQVQLAAQEILVRDAIARAGENKVALDNVAAHQQALKEELHDIRLHQLTRDDIAELLEVSVNASIVTGFKRLGWFIVVSTTGAIITFLTTPISFK